MTEAKLAGCVRDLTRAVKANDKAACCDCLGELLEDCSAAHGTGVVGAAACPDLDAACADLAACGKPAGAVAAGVGAIGPDDIALILQFVQMAIRWWRGS